MRKKKTVTQTRNHRKTSSRKQSGLTARSTNAQQSARPRSALDNRSHRTDMRFTCAATTAPDHGRGSTTVYDSRTI
jgi:hypothetical protein